MFQLRSINYISKNFLSKQIIYFSLKEGELVDLYEICNCRCNSGIITLGRC